MTGSALRQRLAVNTSAPSAARRLLREWLAALRWPVEGIDDLVLAANEAVSDAVLLALIENDQFGSSNLTSLACAD
jgi:anti-sigma regulatory factor (Ser/Thr protein kinase)